MANTKTNNETIKNLYAELRPVIVDAHNAGNKKAISKKDIEDYANVRATAFTQWEARCKLLRDTTYVYVTKKKNSRFDNTITESDIKEAREKIYPMWKELLSFGEKSKYAKELRCSEADVEDLIGFVWKFVDTGKGTAETVVKETEFRKKVESLLGCIIARNAVLTEEEREILSKYQKALRTQTKAQDRIDEFNKVLTGMEITYKGIPESNKAFREYMEQKILEVKGQIEEQETKKTEAKAKETEVKKDALAIQKKMKQAK